MIVLKGREQRALLEVVTVQYLMFYLVTYKLSSVLGPLLFLIYTE